MLKDWKKISTTKFKIVYRNLKSGEDLILKKWDEKKWDVLSLKIAVPKQLKKGTKSQALNYAKAYMRSH